MPAAGYPLRTISRRGPQPHATRCSAARARAARGAAPCRARARCCGELRAGRRAWAAAATSPGPVGLAARHAAHPARADRGRQPPRADQPAARAVRAARLPGVPARRAATGARYRVTGRPVPPPRADRAGARERFGIGAEETLRARVRRLARRALDQPRPRSRRSPARLPRAARLRARATTRAARARAAGAATTCASTSTSPTSADALAAADLVVARAGGSVFEIAAHGAARRSSCPIPHAAGRPPERQRALDGRGGRGGRDRRRRADARAAGARGRRAARRPRAAGARWRAASRGAGAPRRRARGRRASCWRPRGAMSAASGPWSGPAAALRRRRRRGDERLRARRARARRRGQRLGPAPTAPYLERLRADGVLRRARSATTPRTCPPATDVEVVYSSGGPGREPRARARRASAACASARARSCSAS